MNEQQINELLNNYDVMRDQMERIKDIMDKTREVYLALEKKAVEMDKRMDSTINSVEEKLKKIDDAMKRVEPYQIEEQQLLDDFDETEDFVDFAMDGEELMQEKSLYDFFYAAGLEVVDKRSFNGALWVTGEEDLLREIVKEAKRKYAITGAFASGRAIGNRYGWYTKSDK